MKTFSPSNKIQIENLLQSWSSKVPVERALTLPSGFYTSRDIFELERHAIFGQNWLLAGRKSQLKTPGDFLTDDFLSEPYIVNLDKSSTLCAHYNVCCHHGMRLLKDNQGHIDTNEIVCPYHGWVYDLNGRLRKAIRLKTIEQFKASKVHLKPISIQTIGPFIYLNFNFLNNDNIDNDISHITHLDKKYLSPTNYEQFEFIERKTYHIKSNWKIFVDNYLDGGYHVPYAHKQLNSILNMNGYKTVIDHPKMSVQYCTGAERTEGSVLYAYLYPNLMFNRYGSLMDTNLVVPIDERNCIVHIDYYYCPQSTTKVTELDLRKDSHRVQEEDVYLCENVQLGLESQAYDSGRYVPTVEHAMHDFHKTLHDQLENYYNHYSK
jgi:choline monooxygenase